MESDKYRITMEDITIVHDGQLSFEDLNQYFPGAVGLSYEKNEKCYLVKLKNGKLQIPNVNYCQVVFPEGM